jgi:hypothetical protein
MMIALASVVAAGTARAAEPVAVFEGDGLTITVTSWSETDGAVAGTIRRGGQAWPFTGTHAEDDDGNETVRGTFKAGNAEHAFSTRQAADADVLTFTTGGKTYRLRPIEAEKAPAEPPAKPEPANPLAGDDDARPMPRAKKADAPRKAVPADGEAPEVLRLKLHAFPDVTMGVPVAYTATLPDGWTSKGTIEWSQGELSYPQPKMELNSAAGGRVRFIPTINLSYTESKGLAIPPQGIRAPDDFPAWFVQAVGQTNKAVSNVELIASRRDDKAEAAQDKISRDTGANVAGIRREVHVITFEYDEAGVRRREEATMMYAVLPAIDNVNIFSQSWAIYTTSQVSAPAEQFEKQKAELYAAAAGVRPTPQWFVQSQALLAELSRIRSDARWAAIRRKGEEINRRFSDDDYRRYKQTFSATSDAAQRDRINTIYETDDFRDTGGEIVNLPMHYQHVYSDGKGNYVLTNNTQNKPGETWNEITPIR